MRADRLISLLMVLQERGRTTAGALAVELETSHRTVLRDVESLAFAGVPIRAVRGRNGGVELQEGFRTELTALNGAEAEGLLLAGVPTLAAALDMYDAAAGARRKLMQALAPEHRPRAAALSSWLHVDIPTTGDRLGRIARAIRRQRRLRLSTGDSASRVLEPLGLVASGGGWFLVGASPGDVIAVDTITSLSVTAQSFTRTDDVDLPGRWAAARGSADH